MGSDCEICGGLGWIGFDVPVGHPQFGKLARCTCSRAQAELSARARRVLSTWGITPNPAQTFGAFEQRSRDASVRQAFQAARGFAQSPGRCLVLWGNSGTGKTHLAMAVTHALLERGAGVLMFTVPDFLDMLRAGYQDNTYGDLLRVAKTADALIFDDLGSERGTEWAEEKLFQVIDARYRQNLPLLISSNVDPERVEPHRLADRLCDVRWSLRVHLVGESYRRTK